MNNFPGPFDRWSGGAIYVAPIYLPENELKQNRMEIEDCDGYEIAIKICNFISHSPPVDTRAGTGRTATSSSCIYNTRSCRPVPIPSPVCAARGQEVNGCIGTRTTALTGAHVAPRRPVWVSGILLCRLLAPRKHVREQARVDRE